MAVKGAPPGEAGGDEAASRAAGARFEVTAHGAVSSLSIGFASSGRAPEIVVRERRWPVADDENWKALTTAANTSTWNTFFIIYDCVEKDCVWLRER